MTWFDTVQTQCSNNDVKFRAGGWCSVIMLSCYHARCSQGWTTQEIMECLVLILASSSRVVHRHWSTQTWTMGAWLSRHNQVTTSLHIFTMGHIRHAAQWEILTTLLIIGKLITFWNFSDQATEFCYTTFQAVVCACL